MEMVIVVWARATPEDRRAIATVRERCGLHLHETIVRERRFLAQKNFTACRLLVYL
jgi:hypothetical protein